MGSPWPENTSQSRASSAESPHELVRAAEQRDAADEGRLEASGDAMVGSVIVNQGKVVRPSQLIASVRRT